MIDRFINAINGCAHDISLRVIFGVDCYCTNVMGFHKSTLAARGAYTLRP